MHEASGREQLIARPGCLRAVCGSGTTIIAAEMTGRVCLAIELMPQYVDVAIQRWQAFTGHTAVLDGDGRSFEAISAERGLAQGKH